MTEHYRIAGIDFQIVGDCAFDREPLLHFSADHSHSPRAVIRMRGAPDDVRVTYRYTNKLIRWGSTPDGFSVFDCFSGEDELVSRAVISPGMREISLYVSRELSLPGHFMKPVMESLFYCLCLFHGGIVLHSAAVNFNGGGLLFSAPSGTGKTTHADLWVEHAGASYINGDRPLLRFFDGALHACGTAWSGSVPTYHNACVPVTAIIFLERHDVNRIRELAPGQAMKYFLPRAFLPYHSAGMMELALQNADAVIGAARCWHLSCTPDIGAMELVKQCVTTSPTFKR